VLHVSNYEPADKEDAGENIIDSDDDESDD
jgi:hypothetical protein